MDEPMAWVPGCKIFTVENTFSTSTLMLAVYITALALLTYQLTLGYATTHTIMIIHPTSSELSYQYGVCAHGRVTIHIVSERFFARDQAAGITASAI
jgi:hypothetical protein